MLGFLTFKRAAAPNAPIIRHRKKVMRRPKWRLNFYRTLASNRRCGVNYARTLNNMAEKEAARRPGGAYAEILAHWADRATHGGVDLDDILSGWVPPLELTILSGFEDETGLLRVIWYLKKQISLRSKSAMYMAYPVITLCVAMVLLYITGNRILPDLYSHQEGMLEAHAVQLFIMQNAWMLTFPTFAIGILIRSTMDSFDGPVRVWLDQHLWPWTAYRRREGQGFMFAYSALIKNRPELQALDALTANARPWHRTRISAIRYYVAEGHSFATSARFAAHGFPDPDMIDTLESVEVDQVVMADILTSLAEEANEEEEQRQTTMITLFVSGTMILVVSIIFIMARAIISTIDLNGITNALQ